jgi:hypothetical protein
MATARVTCGVSSVPHPQTDGCELLTMESPADVLFAAWRSAKAAERNAAHRYASTETLGNLDDWDAAIQNESEAYESWETFANANDICVQCGVPYMAGGWCDVHDAASEDSAL